MDELISLKGPSLIDKASKVLTDYIINNVTPGEYLPPEHELSKKLGIGRSTLREVISVLEFKGLVKRFHGQGVQVVDESQRAVSDMFRLFMKRENSTLKDIIEVRNIIEVKSAALAAEKATGADLQTLKETLQTMKSKKVSLVDYIQADMEFHLTLARASRNKVLLLLLEAIRPLLYDTILTTLKSHPRPEQILHYHEKVLSAIEKQDSDNASKAMIEHMKGTEAMIDESTLSQSNTQSTDGNSSENEN